jgi:hypothetical protein
MTKLLSFHQNNPGPRLSLKNDRTSNRAPEFMCRQCRKEELLSLPNDKVGDAKRREIFCAIGG